MRAALTPAFGGPDVLQLVEIHAPTPGPTQIRVRVRAAAVTEGDRRLRAADFPGATALFGRLYVGLLRPRRPVQGTIFAGRVEAVGAAVTRFRVGDDVFGLSLASGAYAELLVVDADGPVAAIPDGISYEAAAAVPYGAGTARHFIDELAAVQPGERVLVLGASGGVGRFAVQLARHRGAEVTGVASGANLDLLRSLGAHEAIDYERVDFTALGRTWDVILDVAGVSSFARSRPVLSERGRYLTLYLSLRVVLAMAWTGLWARVRPGPRALFSIASEDADTMGEVAALLAAGVFSPRVGPSRPLADIRQAHAAAEGGRLTGCVVVTMDAA